MARICPNCEKENPSVAKFCMFCPAQLVDVEEFSESDDLRRKNAELQEQIELLKRKEELEKKVWFENTALSETVEQSKNIRNTAQISYQTSEDKSKMFSAPFIFVGRIRRLEYGLSMIMYFAFAFLVGIFLGLTGNEDNDILMYVILIPGFWFILAQGAKRCHDLGKSGWYQIIPFYSLWMLFAEGDKENNKYGVSPK